MALRPTSRATRHTGPAAFLAAWVVAAGAAHAQTAAERAGLELFEAKVRPLLVAKCYSCHSDRSPKPKGSFRLDTRDALRRGGASGPAIVPGDADASLLVQAVARTGDVSAMPPKEPLSAAEVADLRRWVGLGAPDPRTGTTAAKAAAADDWWSLRPLQAPAVPRPADPSGWGRGPVDAFVLQRLHAAKLAPAAEADRRTLIRRVTLDLTGLPPTPAEVAAFVADTRSDAYERLVDRLLASPHHGERQARLWMDLVHFAETHGHDQDRVRPDAWPYRDYLVRSFNRDTPYARFVQEQVAADVLFPDEPGLTVALGFLAAGPWDESSLRDIRDDSIDRQIGFYLDRDDMVSTVMSTFVSTTVHCARCHDHKFDPVSQADYYSLQAVFAGVDKAVREYDLDPETARRRAALTQRLAALRAGLNPVENTPEFRRDVADWESRQTAWRVVRPAELHAEHGSTLATQPDDSVLASGKKPPREVYRVRFRSPLTKLTGLRLEVLPDDRLPSRGPGRNDNGNLHLTEFRVSVAPASDPTRSRPLTVGRASADFDQAGWGASAAVDGNAQTAWGIYPKVGEPHAAVFELTKDAETPADVVVTVELEQTYPEGHPIGRFRLAVTDAFRPIKPDRHPDAVAAALAVPAARRSDTHWRELIRHIQVARAESRLAALPPKAKVFAAAAEFAPDAGHKAPGGPRPVHVLRRGDIHMKGDEAGPGTLACLPGLPSRFRGLSPPDEASRRAALSRWLTDPRNGLTYRSIVNRVWQQHFGRGLVDSPNDFGRMGAPPSHPELLDWLAATFRDGGGSLKALHRAIVTSEAYRQVSAGDGGASADGDNRLLWRQNRRRLDADQYRDAVLLASGRLDRTMGGPSVQNFAMRPGVHVTPVVDYSEYDWSKPGSGRRSVYRFLFRTIPDPFMDALDAADASQLTAARTESVTALQALALWNNAFVLRFAGEMARRLESEAGDRPGQVSAAFASAYGRKPTDSELAAWSAHAERFGLAATCRVLLNTNEFLFID